MRWRRDGIFLALVIVVTAGVFGPIATHEFIAFDDPGYVASNPRVRDGLTLGGVKWAFTTGAQSSWTPLTWLSHMAVAGWFGTTGSVGGLPASGWHHFLDLLLHLSNSILLFAFLRSATGAFGRSAAVAALFALHPLHVEAVAWVSARKDTLSTFFGLAALLAYLQYARRPGVKRYLIVAALLALGLLAKPMLVTWPFLMLLVDCWPLRRLHPDPDSGVQRVRRARWLVLEKLPLIALVAACCVITVRFERPALHLNAVVPLRFRLENALVSVLDYVEATVWPSGLAVLYPYPRQLPATRVIVAATFVAGSTALALISVRRRPYVTVGWLWFVGTLLPVIGIVQFGLHARADRFTYVPLIGLFVLLAWGASDLVARWPRARPTLLPTSAALLVACATASAHQVRYWSDTVTLFRHTCEVTANNGWAHRILGTALLDRGQPDEAVVELESALRVWPGDPEAHNNLGCALERQGRLADAVREYRAAAALDPADPGPRRNLARLLARGRAPEPRDARR